MIALLSRKHELLYMMGTVTKGKEVCLEVSQWEQRLQDRPYWDVFYMTEELGAVSSLCLRAAVFAGDEVGQRQLVIEE